MYEQQTYKSNQGTKLIVVYGIYNINTLICPILVHLQLYYNSNQGTTLITICDKYYDMPHLNACHNFIIIQIKAHVTILI